MTCREWQEHLVDLWEQQRSVSEFERHAAECPECLRYLRDLRLVRAGFGALKLEAVPEPSLGFSERVVRRLAEIGKRPALAEFFESIGRRFVYATLALTFLALLALTLPSAGPIRGYAFADLLTPSEEITQARLDPLSENALPDIEEAPPSTPVAPPR